MIDEDLQKFSGSRVMRTIAIGRVPIRNLPNIAIGRVPIRNLPKINQTAHSAKANTIEKQDNPSINISYVLDFKYLCENYRKHLWLNFYEILLCLVTMIQAIRFKALKITEN
ncbi:hypothetical protein AVEN_148795-1 [Araneus ventricosus]|uniref:Uncharacterized protein n=1 Tax=Araneus ventricosus TaxID=182803 RepID=A0A4Y2UYR0_ARAVE|nr:hypothetical protein AVEN_148795-1 [Araneus ventricosus]